MLHSFSCYTETKSNKALVFNIFKNFPVLIQQYYNLHGLVVI